MLRKRTLDQMRHQLPTDVFEALFDEHSLGQALYELIGTCEQAQAYVLADHVRAWLLGKPSLPGDSK